MVLVEAEPLADLRLGACESLIKNDGLDLLHVAVVQHRVQRLFDVRRVAHPDGLDDILESLLQLHDELLEREVEEHLPIVRVLRKYRLARRDGVLHLILRPLDEDPVERSNVVHADVSAVVLLEPLHGSDRLLSWSNVLWCSQSMRGFSQFRSTTFKNSSRAMKLFVLLKTMNLSSF